jgi:hypothetical protein
MKQSFGIEANAFTGGLLSGKIVNVKDMLQKIVMAVQSGLFMLRTIL